GQRVAGAVVDPPQVAGAGRIAARRVAALAQLRLAVLVHQRLQRCLRRRHLPIAELLRAPDDRGLFLARRAGRGDADDLVGVLPLELAAAFLPFARVVARAVAALLDGEDLGAEVDAVGVDAVEPALLLAD